ncbi:MAG TPA: hypothetical protein VFX84_00475, partial [Candidatus Saccharimonadales bacterium]|nr:hypothetical protein [Candidatus Saccharimonadales bacterium]
TPELTDRLISVSHDLLVKTLPRYVDGQVEPYPQPDVKPTFSRKLSKSDGLVDWSKPARRLEREIRAYAGWPKSRAKLGATDAIITKARAVDEDLQPGFIHAGNKRLIVGAGEGALEILALKPAGKREMTAEAFLAGYEL